ncbi:MULTISPECIES: hypothetical protein [Enterococcus]|uniref:hypothetical protein n=1 Tax=Enterococcus TaxID=1350 RepID=UPI001162BEDD|nr:hypothetical protein [Enterococcus avium]HAP3021224.1 hypothetical protein [Enterococcus faecalis]AYQ24200.1 hypothetical protein AUF16_06175 [Enterococcus avium]HBI1562054.1 hypothetical protein [Enterococcus faecalis]HBI1565113.1 hypothetical protein [Enterococcus faecalis]HBI1717425.1 hypothetical protein [Enterococcus faecalis]
MAKLKCPSCKSTNIQLLDSHTNEKSKKTTSLNLNPLKPFTVFNHKEKKKKKVSGSKVALGVATGGLSLLATGTKQNKGRELHCMNCGNVWKAK